MLAARDVWKQYTRGSRLQAVVAGSGDQTPQARSSKTLTATMTTAEDVARLFGAEL